MLLAYHGLEEKVRCRHMHLAPNSWCQNTVGEKEVYLANSAVVNNGEVSGKMALVQSIHQ